MQSAKYNIRVSSLPDGWRWELIDRSGGAILSGAAPDYEAAMESGWRAVRSFVPASSNQFPEIILSNCKGRH